MKRWKYGVISLLLAGLLGLSGCSQYPEQAADGTPWDSSWTMLGSVLGAEEPGNGFSLLDNYSVLTGEDIYYAAWVAGDSSAYTNEDNEEVEVYDAQLYLDSPDELGRLAASFNRMTEEYRQNLERSVQRQKELNETQLRMLQAQLNPHFLYNTLDCMKWLGVANHVPQIAAMSTDLAALLRAGISGSELIPLEDELELVRQYLNIQEIRFEDRFVCEIDVDERFQHCIVPKMVLQPLVENAIIHGVADLEEGYIKLWAESDGDDLLLRVSDNGRGIEPEGLARLARHEDIPGGHLGLNNVDRIIRLYYGEGYGLTAASDGGNGSCITLRLPMTKGEDHAEGIDR